MSILEKMGWFVGEGCTFWLRGSVGGSEIGWADSRGVSPVSQTLRGDRKGVVQIGGVDARVAKTLMGGFLVEFYIMASIGRFLKSHR